MKTPKQTYKGFSLGERYPLAIDLKTDDGQVIPAGTSVKVVHITPCVRDCGNGLYFFNCDTDAGERVRPGAHELMHASHSPFSS